MGDGLLALTWNNHNTTFVKTLSLVRIKEKYTDVTLSCDGRFYQLHKLVLSTCSEYFEKIFEQTPCKHPVIVLRDVSCEELEALLNYMYLGSVSVAQNDLARLIKVAELFQIKGLAVPDEPPKNSDCDTLSSKKTENRDRTSSQRTTVSETNRTRPSASDSSDAPVPKRSRISENYASSDRTSSNKDRSRSDNINRSQESRCDNTGSNVTASTGIEESSFPVKIKQEIIDEGNSEFVDPASFRRGFDSSGDPDPGGAYDPLTEEEPQTASVFIPKAEPQDIPPDDDPSIAESGMEEESYAGEDIIGLPGPSDAQGWYSEGDSSCGLPGAEGSIGDESQEMPPMMTSQQQQQQPQGQAQQSQQQQPPMVDRVITSYQKEGESESKSGKKYQCTYCSYSSWIKVNLTKHLLVHTGERPYPCHFCPASFSQKGNLKTHLRTHTGEKPFACTICSYRATQKCSLQSHMLKHSRMDLRQQFLSGPKESHPDSKPS